MPKLLENREVHDLEKFPPDLFVVYTKNSISKKDQDEKTQVRLRATLFKDLRGNQKMELVHGSWVCDTDADYDDELRRHAMEIFERAVGRKLCDWNAGDAAGEDEMTDPDRNEAVFKELQAIRKKVYGAVHPLRRFLDNHFDTIALLYDWAPITQEQYWNTLVNQLIPQLPQKAVSALTARDFDLAIAALERKFTDAKGREYSENRLGKFVSNLLCVMEYAADYYEIPNVLVDSAYYDKGRLRYRQESLEQRIEKHLRVKSLDLQEELRLADLITGLMLNRGHEDREIEKEAVPVGAGVGFMGGFRPAETCGIHFGSRIPFSQTQYHNRHYLLVQNKVTPDGKQSPDLKTINGFRGIPVLKALDCIMDYEEQYVQRSLELPEEALKHRLVLTKDGSIAMKPKDLSLAIGKILRRCLKEADEKLVHTVPVQDENGDQIPIEENVTSYQLRRNFCSNMLNKLGFSLKKAMAAMGHYIAEDVGRRWMYYNEDALIEDMHRMDQLILFPIASEAARKYPWEQTDPRKEIIELGHCGEYQDAAALTLQATPYTQEDCVTVRLHLSTKEPSDALQIRNLGEASVTMDADVFYGRKAKKTPLNLLNTYWDNVFAAASYSNETREALPAEESELEPAEIDTDYMQMQCEMAESELLPDEIWTLRGDELSEADLSEEDDE